MLKVHTGFNKISMLFFIFTIPYVGSLYITDNNILNIFFLFGKICVLLILSIYIFLIKRNISLVAVFIISMQIYLVIVTYCESADIRRCFSTILPILGVVLLYEMGFDFPREFIVAQYYIFYIFIVLNLITELIFPNGLYYAELTGYTQYWILGYYNNHTLGYIPAICFALLYKQIYKKYWGPNILIFVIVISALLVRSGGVIFTLGVIIVFLFILRIREWTINFYWAWAIHMFFSFFILILKNERIINSVIIMTGYIFNKSQSFIARFHLWRNAIEHINQKLIWGHGIESQLKRLSEYGWGLHTHNFVLEILHQGGIVYAGIFVVLLILVGKKFNSCHNVALKGSIIIPILGWVVDTLMEPFMTAFLLGLLIIAFHIEDVEKVIKD